MKEWDKNIKQCDVSIESKKPKFIRAFYPWNEELAQQCKVEKTHYEPVKEKQEKAPAFEYSIEIACALDEFNTYQIGVFSLGKTKEEANISTWSKIQTEKGNTLLTASVNVDEPKILYREFFISSGSAMTFNNVKPVKKGTANAIDSFVPIKPSVQIYDLLSWPKIGFFYHFIDDVLVNEYQLAGGDKWSFKITHSKGKELSNELLSEHEYSFILLPWKINNTLVARQHLLYTKEKITQEQLSEISAKWLDDNARILNPDQIVEARTEKQVERKKDSVYIVQPGDIFSNIARKQGIKYQTLIDLNPQIKDIHLINPGDVIFIKEGERIPSTATVALSHHSSGDPKYDESSTSFDISTTCPVELNQSKTVFPFYNVWVSSNRHFTELAYMLAQEEKTIKGTTAIVNVKSIALQSKLLAISEKLESIAQGKKEIIKKGAKGNEVKLLQEALLKMKFNLGSAGADGDFGKGTHDAIIDFQTKFVPTHEIHPEYQIKEVDGIVGKSTLLGLDEAIAIGWERKIPPFKWHEPLLNPISTNYYQGGETGSNQAYAWGLFGKEIRKAVGNRHDGLDLFAEVGTDVYASVDGEVTYASLAPGYGKVIIVSVEESEIMWANRQEYKPRTNLTKVELKQYDDFEVEYNKNKQLYLMYGHLDSINNNIKVGVKVKSGDIIGKTGVSGITHGTHAPHLHFEVKTKKTIKKGDLGRCNPSLFVNFKDYSQQSEDDRKRQKDARDKEAKKRKK